MAEQNVGETSVSPNQTEGGGDLKSSTADEAKAVSASACAPTLKMLNVLIFGGTGRTGKEVLKQALALGHKVTVVVRSPEKVDIE